jgi:uncharacterized membrane protein YgdD (TMEM256/DUF423 family)
MLAGVLGAVAVALGAFGAHGLANIVDDPHLIEVWEKAARYHLVHAVVLLGVALRSEHHPSATLNTSGWLFTAGITVFSGSLYLLAVTGIRWLGAITPIGGVALIAGWLALAWSARREET